MAASLSLMFSLLHGSVSLFLLGSCQVITLVLGHTHARVSAILNFVSVYKSPALQS